MRSKSDQRREQIAAVAAQLFAERGFDDTSIDDIVKRIGGSKTTIYAYFGSKEGLLRGVLDFDLSNWIGNMSDALLPDEDLKRGLAALGIAYLTRMLGTHAIGHLRIGTAQSTRSAIGSEYYRHVLKPGWEALAYRLERLMNEERLTRADPWTAAMHWKGLNEGNLCERRLLGDLDGPDSSEIAKAAENAASAFLCIYGPPTTPNARQVTTAI